MQLFCGRPTLEIFERRWRPDAEFEDPLCKCIGFNEYAPQFFALVSEIVAALSLMLAYIRPFITAEDMSALRAISQPNTVGHLQA